MFSIRSLTLTSANAGVDCKIVIGFKIVWPRYASLFFVCCRCCNAMCKKILFSRATYTSYTVQLKLDFLTQLFPQT